MILFLKKFIAKFNFSRKIHSEWFAYNASGVKSADEPHKYLVPYYDSNGKYINYSVGDVVPMLEDHGYIAFYKITSFLVRGNDLAPWDDGRHYELKLDHLEKKT